jgi:hypothetical protein
MNELIIAIQKYFAYINDMGRCRGPDDHYYCPLCRNWEDRGHLPDCPITLIEQDTGTKAVRANKYSGDVEWK